MSDPTIEPDIYEITVELDDATFIETFVIKLIVQEVIISEEEVVDEAVEPTSSTSDSADTDTSEPEAEEEEVVEDEVELEPQSTAVFDWEAAFAELERRRKKKAEEAGEVYVPPAPPQVSSVTIDDTGLVKIFFTKDMAEITDLKVITETLSADKTPIFSV